MDQNRPDLGEGPSFGSDQIDQLTQHYPAIMHAAAHRLSEMDAMIRDTVYQLGTREREILSAETISPDDYGELPRLLAAATMVGEGTSPDGYVLWELTLLGCELRWHLMALAEDSTDRE